MRPPPRRTSTPARVLRETWIAPVAIGDARDVLPPSLLPPGNAEPLRRYPCERFDDALLMFGGGRIRSSSDSPLEEAGFELFVPLGISASPSWWSRARKPHGAPQGSFSVAGPIVRIHLPPVKSRPRTSRAKSNPLSPGTEGSNPALSSGDSATNRERPAG
jgi:hypothetical protein